MPTLITKHQKQVAVTRLKKAYSVLSQMVVRTYADNGAVSDFLTTSEIVNADKTKQFFDTYWLPYFKGAMVANPHFYNNSSAFNTLSGQKSGINIYTNYSAGRILFSTQDGTIYYVCVMDWERDEEGNNLDIARYRNQQSVNVDINGVKPPNTYGKDVFLFNVDFNSNIVRAECSNQSMTYINNNCKKNGVGICCAAKIINDGWQIKDDYPW